MTSQSSTLRHRPINTTAQANPITRRSSRPSRVLGGQSMSQRDYALIDQLATQRFTDEDEQIEITPSTRAGRGRYNSNDTRIIPAERNPYYQPKPNHNRLWAGIGAGMCSALFLLVVGLHIYAWAMDSLHDPNYYTQANHRDMVTVTDGKGGQEQVRVFVDADGYLDELIVPKSGSGPISKVKIVRGPSLSKFSHPQQALINVTASNGQITAYADGPREVGFWGDTRRDHAEWTTDYAGNTSNGEAK